MTEFDGLISHTFNHFGDFSSNLANVPEHTEILSITEYIIANATTVASISPIFLNVYILYTSSFMSVYMSCDDCARALCPYAYAI